MKPILRLLYNVYVCLAIVIFLVLTILTALTTIIGSLLGGAHTWGYYPGKVWSVLTCRLLLLPVKVAGREKLHRHTSYVFVPNHQGAFDIFLIYGFLGRNFKWLMKESLRRIPFVGRACQSAGHIFINRSNPKKIAASMRQAEASLVDGVSLVVFPEGSRSKTGRLGRFKKGAFQMADELQLAVVPVSIAGTYEVMPSGSRWVHWHAISLTIHDPIAPQGRGPENVQATMDQAWKAVAAGLPERYL